MAVGPGAAAYLWLQAAAVAAQQQLAMAIGAGPKMISRVLEDSAWLGQIPQPQAVSPPPQTKLGKLLELCSTNSSVSANWAENFPSRGRSGLAPRPV